VLARGEFAAPKIFRKAERPKADSGHARRANVTGLGAREPRARELASAESGNLGLNKAAIR
jgi:hypothetical protein